jgi:hypothetical protein
VAGWRWKRLPLVKCSVIIGPLSFPLAPIHPVAQALDAVRACVESGDAEALLQLLKQASQLLSLPTLRDGGMEEYLAAIRALLASGQVCGFVGQGAGENWSRASHFAPAAHGSRSPQRPCATR